MAELNWREKLRLIATLCVQIGTITFGAYPYTHKLIIFKIYTYCWICDVIFIVCFALFYEMSTDIFSLDGLMDLLLSLSQMLTHLTVLVESLVKHNRRSRLRNQRLSMRMQLSWQMKDDMEAVNRSSNAFWSIFLGLGIVACTVVHTLLSWTVYPSVVIVTMLYWHSLPSVLALQFEVLNVMCDIVDLNDYAMVIRMNIDDVGERNLDNFIKKESTSSGRIAKDWHEIEAREERTLITLKRTYANLFTIYEALSDCYGWSMLAFMTMYFIYFIVNTYFVLLALITQRNSDAMIEKNLGFVMIVIMELGLVCWQCQTSSVHSGQISCIIYKLLKPTRQGSYNDLITDFYLQMMHQPFVMKIKYFFDVNLNLLGSMLAAVVTYLVILIQFLLAAKTKAEHMIPPNSSRKGSWNESLNNDVFSTLF